REVAVRDRRAERAVGLRALDVDVDPLVVAAEFGELVDHLLRDLAPAARADELTLQRADLIDAVGDGLGNAGAELHRVPFLERRGAVLNAMRRRRSARARARACRLAARR